jgi:Holliday junction resolvasome RuvABC DNA-binding subunit
MASVACDPSAAGWGTPPRPAAAPDVLAIALDGALERTRGGWKEVKLGAVAAEAGTDGEVLAWLTAMGFSAAEAQAAVAKLPRDPSLPVEERVRHALVVLRPE